ncbi:MAG: AbrB/MazE/SpoVT family DNA-binding domain-containing protein [Clostridia bacterium]|nr:AbrB/MazE/SpoVT family DNA-binding domain-containing protein [Clostridia bacterium]
MNGFAFTKKFDNLGRIVIPIEMRKYYGFKKDENVQIIPQKNGILIVSKKKK